MKKINLIKHTNFVIAICIPLIALLVQWELWSFIKPFVWFLFYPAVFFSARIAGLKGGIASTLFSTLIVWYFFIPPMFSLQMENTNNLFSIIVFI
ncbi:MAG: DUF4118 domain-containing protein, partial [Salinivirgaceae bacterium]|nr:DUF4118 domain-containing protein [Salinivirgaceae bacterium]